MKKRLLIILYVLIAVLGIVLMIPASIVWIFTDFFLLTWSINKIIELDVM